MGRRRFPGGLSQVEGGPCVAKSLLWLAQGGLAESRHGYRMGLGA